jgi:DMSO/TMAO reductase YedYZ molybdopterin-dependent catalytic subunit
MIRRRDFVTGGLAALGASLWPEEARAAAERYLIQHGQRPQELATPIEFYDRLLTPNDVFFVRSHFGPPALRTDRRLLVHGLVEEPLDLSLPQLRKFPEVTVTAVLQCAGNSRASFSPPVPGVQWGHGAMGQATWTGVRLADVLAAAKVKPGARHVQLRGADVQPKPSVPAFIRSIPLERALQKDTLLAYRMNGEPLPLAHGAPLRLVVPGWAGDSWLKWLIDVEVQEDEGQGFFMQKAYRYPKERVEPGASVPPEKMGPAQAFPVRSLIARPLSGSTAKPGRQEIVGVAFSGKGTVTQVEVSVDGGSSWHPANLEGESGIGRWQLFRYSFDTSRSGTYRAMARATDATGAVQPRDPMWNPSGYFWNGIHEVSWEVQG